MISRPASSGRFAPRGHQRASDPREFTPNDNGAGPNVPPQSVGPTSSEGYGNTHVMYPAAAPPPQAQAWSGWPVEWGTPYWGQEWSGDGYGRQLSTLWGRVSTVMNCVDLNSRQLGSFPVYGVTGDTPFTLPQWSINPEPELYASWTEFVMAAVNSLLLRGEAIVTVTGRYSTGWPARFVLLNPDVCEVELLDGRHVVTLGGRELPRRDVCVVRYQSWPMRPRGVSPLEWLGHSLLTSEALERYAANLATRGGIPWAVLKAQRNIDPQQAADTQANWVAAAARRDGAPAVLGNAFELQPLTISPRDMALLELREFDERRICAAFGVPAYLVNVEQAGGMTYANAVDLRIQHWQATLRPLAGLLATGWSSFLLPHGQRIEFNPDRYTQPALADRANAWAVLHNIVDPVTGQRAMTIDEIRAAERLVPTPTPAAASLDDAARLTGAAL